MTEPEPRELAALRRRVDAEIAELLPRRDPAQPGRVLGAGSDDFTSGRHFLDLLAGGGYAVPAWPADHGGMGLDRVEADVVSEVLAGFATPDMYPFLVGLDLIGPTIMVHGSAEQQARWLPPMRSGAEIWCQMFSEPDAGSDLANLSARAVRDGEEWRVSGSKVWTSRAHYSQWGLLLTRSDPSRPKHRGITAFGLDFSRPGITVRPLVQMNGDTHFNEVFLDDVVVPDRDRIGAEGEGWRVAITCLSLERGSLAGGLGISADQLRRLSRPGDAVHRDRLARSWADLRITEWTGARAQAARRAGKPVGPEDSGAKLRTNHMVKGVADLAMEVEGPSTTVAGADGLGSWQETFLVSPSLSIRGGTDEIQRNILGERVLGLPPEPRVDKDRPFSER